MYDLEILYFDIQHYMMTTGKSVCIIWGEIETMKQQEKI